mmetsp:Transcript_2346/g.7731  ORF Transcript_2346/g.7731 Transcript_2346/m.7731 type:complete len:305 (-) Transcript_2346:470-1384(-)
MAGPAHRRSSIWVPRSTSVFCRVFYLFVFVKSVSLESVHSGQTREERRERPRAHTDSHTLTHRAGPLRSSHWHCHREPSPLLVEPAAGSPRVDGARQLELELVQAVNPQDRRGVTQPRVEPGRTVQPGKLHSQLQRSLHFLDGVIRHLRRCVNRAHDLDQRPGRLPRSTARSGRPHRRPRRGGTPRQPQTAPVPRRLVSRLVCCARSRFDAAAAAAQPHGTLERGKVRNGAFPLARRAVEPSQLLQYILEPRSQFIVLARVALRRVASRVHKGDRLANIWSAAWRQRAESGRKRMATRQQLLLA